MFGEVFWSGAICRLLGISRLAAVRRLEELTNRELISKRKQSRYPGEEEYAFRHALLREGAYTMLTPGDRVLGHKLAGEWLEEHGEHVAIAELDGRYLSTEVAGGFTGRVIGMYAAEGTVAFDWFEYAGSDAG